MGGAALAYGDARSASQQIPPSRLLSPDLTTTCQIGVFSCDGVGSVRGSVSRADQPVLFQYSIDRSSGFSMVVAEDAAQPFLSNDRP